MRRSASCSSPIFGMSILRRPTPAAARTICACDHRDRAAAGRSLVLGAAGYIDGAGSRQAGDQSADGGAGMARRADVGVVEHGMAKAAHAAVRRCLRLGENIDQTVRVIRASAEAETDAIERRDHGGEDRSSRASPHGRSRRGWPTAANCPSRSPHCASARCRPRRRRPTKTDPSPSDTWLFADVAVDLAERRGDAERRGAARIAHRPIGAGGHRLVPALRRASTRSLVSSGHLICTKCTSCGSSMPASPMATCTALTVSSICDVAADLFGQESRGYGRCRYSGACRPCRRSGPSAIASCARTQ